MAFDYNAWMRRWRKQNPAKVAEAQKRWHAKHPLYNTWRQIITRCTKKGGTAFDRYGARGITVCKRWLHFKNFEKDMSPRPSSRHSIERIDNDGPYSLKNCTWATAKEQARNRRSNRLLTHDGMTLTLSEWAERTGIHRASLDTRLKLGWSINDAFTRKIDRGSSRRGIQGHPQSSRYKSKPTPPALVASIASYTRL